MHTHTHSNAVALQGLLGVFTGLLDMGVVDTTPGARCALAPPASVELTASDYTDLMRLRYRTIPAHRQQMQVFARRLGYIPITGPWANEAKKILEAIAR